MLRGMAIIVIACLAGLVPVGCSRHVAPPPPSTSVIPEAEREYVVEDSKKRDSENENLEDQEKSPVLILEEANELCREQSQVRGIRSIAAIFRRRSREKAYAECMQKKGFTVQE